MSEGAFKLAISSDFLKQIERLPRAKRKKVDKFVRNFQNNPTAPGLNYETIRNASDPSFRSVRFDGEYRVIVHKPSQGNIYLLCWIDKHDEAYAWAERRRCEVHPRTGTLQMYVVEEQPQPPTEEPSSSPSTTSEPVQAELFGEYNNEELHELGVPTAQLGLVRSVSNEENLQKLQPKLPEEVYEGLQYLKEGIPLNEVMELLHSSAETGRTEEEVDTSDIEAALKRASSRRSFWVADNEFQLQEMLDAPLEQWRVFLHPSQRKYVEKDFNGSARILGGAGTGKTVVAMHRAVHLARTHFPNDNDKIFFTTFTKNLAHDIESALTGIAKPQELARIEVLHLHGWVQAFLKRQKYQYKVAFFDDRSGRKLQELWSQALLKAPTELGLPNSFYREEWEQVIQYHGVDSSKMYSRIRRTGRGTKLRKKQRLAVWKVFEEYRLLLEEHKIREHIDAVRDARIILTEQPHLSPFKAVIVDEAQDLSPEAYRFLRALVPEGKNDIFVVGDGHQRIYRYKVALKHCGIRIVGRSHRLKLNYRTTDEIRKAAVRVLEDVAVDDMDEGLDSHKGYISLLHGQQPLIHQFDSFAEELDFLVSLLKENENSHSRTCLVTRTGDLLGRYVEGLQSQGVETVQIRRSLPDTEFEALRVATMHRVKGLEFDRVIIAGLNDSVVPLLSAMANLEDETEKESAEVRERCLLYVALTRAKKEVFLTSHGVPSRFLQTLNS